MTQISILKTGENKREERMPPNVSVSCSLSNKITGQASDHGVQKFWESTISAYNGISLFITHLAIHCLVFSSSLGNIFL